MRGVLDEDVTYTFAAIPDRPPTIALTKEPEPQPRGALQLSYKVEDDYGVIGAQATFALKERKGRTARRARPLYSAPDLRWCCRNRVPATAPPRPRKICPIIRGRARTWS